MDGLVPHIYHERQEPGTMTCGQHALNSLLQGKFFTEEDLANIGRTLDVAEHDIEVDASGRASGNVDETGYFSVQVLEQALQIWNLSLVNWRSAEMRLLNAHPEDQLSFILNLSQHWLTLRRFGPAPGYWYNLNSFHESPQWISSTYLGMFLNQAETEGYTVFAVRQIDESVANPIPISPSDEIATHLLNIYGPTPHPPSAEQIHSLTTGVPLPSEEDPELAAAIAASLEDHPRQAAISATETFLQQHYTQPVSGSQAPSMDTVLGITGARHIPIPPELSSDRAGPSRAPDMETEVSDAQLAESVARSTAALERFRMSSAEDLPEMVPGSSRKRNAATDQTAPKRRRTAGEEEEEELVRRALAASTGNEEAYIVDEDEDMGDAMDDDEFDLGPFGRSAQGPAQPRGAPPIRAAPRVLDDEDLELQAALRASLEDPAASVLTIPEHVVPVRRDLSGSATPATAPVPPSVSAQPPAHVSTSDGVAMDDEEDEDTEEEVEQAAPEPAAAELDLDEIRRRRLARFGG